MPEEFPSTIAWRRRLGFWDDVRWTRRHLQIQIYIQKRSTSLALKRLTLLYYSQPALHINNWLYQMAHKSESLSVRMKISLTEGNVFLSA